MAVEVGMSEGVIWQMMVVVGVVWMQIFIGFIVGSGILLIACSSVCRQADTEPSWQHVGVCNKLISYD